MDYIESTNTIIISPYFNDVLTNEYLEIKSKFNKVIFSNYELSNELFEQYKNNKLIRRAVERELEIIGEAMNKLLKRNPELKINESRRIVDLRNWIIHGYDRVDDIIIWGIISKDLPALKEQVSILLKK